jgi:hypothetical protein
MVWRAVNMIHMAQNRGQWWAGVKTVMNLGGFIKILEI